MKKFLLGFMGLFLMSFRTSPESVVLWNREVKLKTEDFKIVDRLQDNTLAASHTGIIISGHDGIYKCVAVFDPKQSFMLKKVAQGYRISEVLSHEQTHFDIAQYVAQKANIELSKIHNPSDALRKYFMYADSLNLMQIVYDYNTEHSNNKVWQGRWNSAIIRMLRDTPVDWKQCFYD